MFKRASYGYEPRQVEMYFQQAQEEHDLIMLKAQEDLATSRETNERYRSIVNKLQDDINNANRRKNAALAVINEELAQYEKNVEEARDESQQIKLNLVNRMRAKQEEFEKWHKMLNVLQEGVHSALQLYESNVAQDAVGTDDSSSPITKCG